MNITESSSNVIALDRRIDFAPDIAFDEYQRAHGIGSTTLRPIRFTAFSDIRVSEAVRYIVKGIVPVSGFVVVWGEPKCGKSFFVFDMVAHVAAGWDYRGRRVKQCPVVYFALEGQQGFCRPR
jgi:RecA-family ATPase